MGHKDGVRAIRYVKARQIGKGNGDEGISPQLIHRGDGEGPRRRSAMTIPVLTRPAVMSEPQYTRDELSRCELFLKTEASPESNGFHPRGCPR